jgi:hypothetical protein
MSQTANTIEDPSKLKPVELWAAEIEAAEKELKKFRERGRIVTRKFIDERGAMESSYKWFNVFYANTQILESALYAQLPKPAVSRKYLDYNDDIARVAALIIQRCITQDLDDPNDNFDSTMRHCVQDRLVPGLATAWLRLETDTEEVSVPPTPGNDLDPEETTLAIKDQRVVIDYVFWEDFLWSPCRVWEERRWTGRKAYMDREELVERFGDEKGKACPLNYSTLKTNESMQGVTPVEDVLKKAVVYEIWDRTTRKIVWYCKGMTSLLDEKDDFLGLAGFEPCPRPMLANVSTSNTTPRPDYYMIQDQYTELDSINNRISMLIQACKVVGVYDKSAVGVQRMLTEGFDNQLIPVDNWAMFAEKGGLKGQIDWLPLETVAAVLQQLNAAREVIKGQIYELTGIADIVRGASKASETLGAQQIKAQFASVRIKKLQDEVARFAADMMRIKAELMIKHFSPEMLIKKSNIMATGNDEYVAPAMQLLQDEDGFEWRISINADTLAQADYAMEKQDRMDMMTSVSKFMQMMIPMLQQAPKSAPLMLSMMKWAIAGFKNADEIEGMLDKELSGLEQLARQPPPPPQPSPEEQKMQAEMQMMQAEMQAKQQEQAGKMQAEQQKNQMDLQKQQMEMQMEQQRLGMELMAEKQRLALEAQQQQMDLQFERLMQMLKLQGAKDQAELKLEATHAQNAAKAKSAASNSD